MGYLWGKAETELNMKPLAISALEMKRKSKLGGKRSGEARRKKASEGWEPHARAIAKQTREIRPSASQDVVADEILAGWKENDHDPPGHAKLKQLVADMEKSGDIPRRRHG